MSGIDIEPGIIYCVNLLQKAILTIKIYFFIVYKFSNYTLNDERDSTNKKKHIQASWNLNLLLKKNIA